MFFFRFLENEEDLVNSLLRGKLPGVGFPQARPCTCNDGKQSLRCKTVNDDPQNVFPFIDRPVCCSLLTVVYSAAVLQDVECTLYCVCRNLGMVSSATGLLSAHATLSAVGRFFSQEDRIDLADCIMLGK
uniref:Uncharacterized protein n=1 Tax=Timema poppense TaxID=170557 RepID=A0A7R9DPT9_TIMPO|nr:unnamed protein product [Timema poppensis]